MVLMIIFYGGCYHRRLKSKGPGEGGSCQRGRVIKDKKDIWYYDVFKKSVIIIYNKTSFHLANLP